MKEELQVIEDFIVEQLYQSHRPPTLWKAFISWDTEQYGSMGYVVLGKVSIRKYVRKILSDEFFNG